MPAKRRPDIWSPAPAPTHSASPSRGYTGDVPTSFGRKHIGRGVGILATVAAAVAVFLAIIAPAPQTGPQGSMPDTSVGAAAPTQPVLPATTLNSQPTTSAPAPRQAAIAQTVEVQSSASAGQPATTQPATTQPPGSGLVASARAAEPVAVSAAAAPAAPAAPAGTGPAEPGIQGTLVTIAGRTYECYGQLAHLACDLRQ